MYRAFDFKCKDCGHVFEEWVHTNEKIQLTCPECFSNRCVKLISSPTVLVAKDAYDRFLHKRPPDPPIVGKPIKKVFKDE